MPRYLGLDSSTQSLSALVIDTDSGKVILDESIEFGSALPEYASPNGFLEHRDPRVKHSNPLMWVDALDRLLESARARGFDWGSVSGGAAARLGVPRDADREGGALVDAKVARGADRSASQPKDLAHLDG
jgi:sugar (pentulose or hexulose) kinase